MPFTKIKQLLGIVPADPNYSKPTFSDTNRNRARLATIQSFNRSPNYGKPGMRGSVPTTDDAQNFEYLYSRTRVPEYDKQGILFDTRSRYHTPEESARYNWLSGVYEAAADDRFGNLAPTASYTDRMMAGASTALKAILMRKGYRNPGTASDAAIKDSLNELYRTIGGERQLDRILPEGESEQNRINRFRKGIQNLTMNTPSEHRRLWG